MSFFSVYCSELWIWSHHPRKEQKDEVLHVLRNWEILLWLITLVRQPHFATEYHRVNQILKFCELYLSLIFCAFLYSTYNDKRYICSHSKQSIRSIYFQCIIRICTSFGSQLYILIMTSGHSVCLKCYYWQSSDN